ncbi:MAG TPA: preprotein translocase subunit SecG [Afifellaceae bacterium]|nr:preprotein translocase subunit SecG [Afifellaceae bacterium]
MTTVLIVVHLMIVLALIAVILLQRSEGGALGMGGGGGGGGLMSGRGVGNLLTRTTAILAVGFFATSIGLTILARLDSSSNSILQQLPGSEAVDTAPQNGQVQTPPSDEGGGGSVLDNLRQQSGSSAPQAPPADGGSQ